MTSARQFTQALADAHWPVHLLDISFCVVSYHGRRADLHKDDR